MLLVFIAFLKIFATDDSVKERKCVILLFWPSVTSTFIKVSSHPLSFNLAHDKLFSFWILIRLCSGGHHKKACWIFYTLWLTNILFIYLIFLQYSMPLASTGWV